MGGGVRSAAARERELAKNARFCPQKYSIGSKVLVTIKRAETWKKYSLVTAAGKLESQAVGSLYLTILHIWKEMDPLFVLANR